MQKPVCQVANIDIVMIALQFLQPLLEGAHVGNAIVFELSFHHFHYSLMDEVGVDLEELSAV